MINSNIPYISLDKDFNIMFYSEQLKDKYSQLFIPDFFKTLLDGYKIDDFSSPVEFQSAIYGKNDISLIFIKNGDVIDCLPVKSRSHSENQHKNIHYGLREPLSSIFAILPIIADNVSKNNSEKAISNLETVNRQSYKLLRNINNLSLADRIISGNIPAAETVDFSSLLETLIVSVKTIHRNITVNYTVDAGVYLKANKNLITSAVLNLFSNSITYKSDDDTVIDIQLKNNGNSTVFSYSDNSKGIKDIYIEDIFNPYFSKDPYADGENDPSLGLGLFLVKTAFEQAGGKIMTSSVFGKGLKYIINMPMTEDDGYILESSSSEFLLNRYSDLFVQLCDSCQLPGLI